MSKVPDFGLQAVPVTNGIGSTVTATGPAGSLSNVEDASKDTALQTIEVDDPVATVGEPKNAECMSHCFGVCKLPDGERKKIDTAQDVAFHQATAMLQNLAYKLNGGEIPEDEAEEGSCLYTTDLLKENRFGGLKWPSDVKRYAKSAQKQAKVEFKPTFEGQRQPWYKVIETQAKAKVPYISVPIARQDALRRLAPVLLTLQETQKLPASQRQLYHLLLSDLCLSRASTNLPCDFTIELVTQAPLDGGKQEVIWSNCPTYSTCYNKAEDRSGAKLLRNTPLTECETIFQQDLPLCKVRELLRWAETRFGDIKQRIVSEGNHPARDYIIFNRSEHSKDGPADEIDADVFSTAQDALAFFVAHYISIEKLDEVHPSEDLAEKAGRYVSRSVLAEAWNNWTADLDVGHRLMSLNEGLELRLYPDFPRGLDGLYSTLVESRLIPRGDSTSEVLNVAALQVSMHPEHERLRGFFAPFDVNVVLSFTYNVLVREDLIPVGKSILGYDDDAIVRPLASTPGDKVDLLRDFSATIVLDDTDSEDQAEATDSSAVPTTVVPVTSTASK
jgi:hypothetical protein